MGSNRQIAKNMIFNTVSFAINFCISFFFTPYLIRMVGKEAYSFFPLIHNMISYTSVITAAVGSMAGRFVTMRVYANDMEGANKYYTSVWVANLFLSVIFSLLAVIGLIYLDNILTIPYDLLLEVRWLFGLGFASLILGLLTGVISMPTYIRNRLDLSSSCSVITQIIRVAAIIILFWAFRPSIVYMSISALLASVIGVIIQAHYKRILLPELKVSPRKYFNYSLVKELIGSGIWNSVNQLSFMLLTQLDLLITNIFIGASATGDYAIAKTAPNLIYSLMGMLSGTFYAYFNILYAKGEVDEVVNQVRKSMVIVSIIMVIPMGFLSILGGDFYHLWVPGQNYVLLAQITVWTLIPMLLSSSINPIFGVFTITNKLRIPSIVLLVSGLLQTAVVLILLKTTDLGIWAIIYTSAAVLIIKNTTFTPIYAAICMDRPWYSFYPTLIRGIAGGGVVVLIAISYKLFFAVDNWFDLVISAICISIIALLLNLYVIPQKVERLYIINLVKDNILNLIKRVK